MHRQPKNGERGFALLFIFALAGIVALTLYNELPRAVFESQRAKEDLLVSRGQEYQRGIQLYFRKFRKYPATMDELEKSNGIRFLRRRYADPFTGKEDWRLVRVGPNGQYLDSKVIKPTQPAQTSGFGANSTSAVEPPKEDPNDPAAKRRASDVSASEIGGTPGQPADPNALPSGAPPPPVGGVQSGMQNGMPYPGRTDTNPVYNQQPVGVGGVGSVGSVGSVGAGLPNTSFPSNTINSQTGGMNGMPIQQQIPGYPQNQPGQRPLTPEQLNPALDVIQRLLTQPRQPPPGVIQGGQAPTGPITNPSGVFTASGPGLSGGGGQFGAGGIAGVASKHEGKGIKLVNDRERIEEWEFIYDPAKDRGGRPAQNAQTQQPGMPGMPGMGNMNPAQGSGFGGQQQGGGFGGGFGGGQMQQGSGGFGRQQGGGFNQPPIGRPRN